MRDAINTKWAAVTLLALCQVAAMALWFSASAVVPSLTVEYSLTSTQASLLTSSVQIGFVFGTLVSAFLGLADRYDSRRFFMLSAAVAAAANAFILLVPPTSSAVVAARFVTGACMAGVYPVGMKMMSTWAKGDLGLLIGILVGALSLGSGSPHFFNAFGGLDWRFTISTASLVALTSAFVINLVRLGPNLAERPPFNPAFMFKAFSSPSIRLALFGYLGHMWELYAMWAWLGVFLVASFQLSGVGADPAFLARFTTFLAIGMGGLIGCVAGGYLADRFGRTTLTMGAMAMSGSCALITGMLFGAHPAIVITACLLWGLAVNADSAQFSASIAELSEPTLIGTMLTVQTCTGFLLTLVTIHLMPLVVETSGWPYAFAVLAVGPFLGVWAMGRLRAHPDSIRLAGGRR